MTLRQQQHVLNYSAIATQTYLNFQNAFQQL